MSSEERDREAEVVTLRKLSKSYEHLDRWSARKGSNDVEHLREDGRQRKVSRPADTVGFGLLPNQVEGGLTEYPE